jgi:hypothetical protein
MIGLIPIGVIVLLAMFLAPILLFGLPIYIAWRLHMESPKRAERIAREETETIYRHALAGSVQMSEEDIETALRQHWPEDTPDVLVIQLLDLGKEIYALEGLSSEIPPPPAIHNSVEAARYRDHIARIGQGRGDRAMHISALDMISQSLGVIARIAPPMDGDVLVEMVQFAHPLGDVIEELAAPYYRENAYNHFKNLRDRLNANLNAMKTHNPVMPSAYKGDDPIETYLAGTILEQVFRFRTPFDIPQKNRFEHLHMIAGSGHGKTQTLQHLISQDLPDIAQGKKSVVVIDSQGDMIDTILKAKHLPPEKIVLIDPEDLEYPVSLNLFSVGQERLVNYNRLEQERLTNSIIELYDYVLGTLLSAGMTAKQAVLFRYVTRLMFVIPDATIHTFRELMEPNGTDQYQQYIEKLQGTARHFFEKEFNGKEFGATKAQVLRRLYGVLENQTFERMFSDPQSKFDMFTELNAGKLILINTSKSLLKEEGTKIFGRFFIALITQAAQERATLQEKDRLPAFIYIDEAHDYFDSNIGIILSQARKYKVGMTMAHQYLGQLVPSLQAGFEANTSIKLAGGVSQRDAQSLSGQMNTSADIIQRQPEGVFATYVRGYTKQAVPISFPFFVLENAPKNTKIERDAIRQHSRIHYASPLKDTVEHSETINEDAKDPPSENVSDDPTKPSDRL